MQVSASVFQSYKISAVFLTCLLTILGSVKTTVSQIRVSENTTIRAAKVKTPPKIDGRLNDPCWAFAEAASGFVLRSPSEGEPATEQTVFRVLYDEDNLYFGLRFLDSQPEKIVRRLQPRDTFFWPNDSGGIMLDTFHDHRNCYNFSFNPLGVQQDAYVRDEKASFDLNWDGAWRVETSIDAKGWTAEVVIPFKTLRFPREEQQVWDSI